MSYMYARSKLVNLLTPIFKFIISVKVHHFTKKKSFNFSQQANTYSVFAHTTCIDVVRQTNIMTKNNTCRVKFLLCND